VVHRDLKPDNILLIQRGREPDFVKVLDFGIAKLTGANKVSMRTRTGLFMGTPAYMSPEQCEDSAAVDLRTDIYALGILLYEMLSGQVPFTGNTYGHIFLQQLTQVPPPLSTLREGIPPHIEAVVIKALAKQADARFQSMKALMAALVDPTSHAAPQDVMSGFSGRDGLSGFVGRDGIDRSSSTLVPVVTPSGQVIQVPSNMLSTPVTPPLERPPRSGRVALIAMLGALLGLGSAGVWWMNQRHGAAAAGSLPDTTREAPGAMDAELRVQAGAPGDKVAARAASGHAGRAAAPVMAPVAVTPAAAQEVLVRVLSRPDGAAVFFNDESRPRGQTPLALSMPRGTGQARLTLRLDGYRDETRRFVPDDNKEYDLQLRREPRPARNTRAVDRSRNTGNPDRQARTGETNRANQNDAPDSDGPNGDSTNGDSTNGNGPDGDRPQGKIVDEDGLEEPPAN
jgi:serine/threonine-protein kinase